MIHMAFLLEKKLNANTVNYTYNNVRPNYMTNKMFSKKKCQ